MTDLKTELFHRLRSGERIWFGMEQKIEGSSVTIWISPVVEKPEDISGKVLELYGVYKEAAP